ncbi:MAG TPA: hypothetical protein VNL71_14870 [Chloroflexota bacterium]|nr:hypothetical protein [Chloroflexota bacterium]
MPVPVPPTARRRPSFLPGLIGLLLLLALAIGGAGAFSAYLLRTNPEQATPAAPVPAPFRVLFHQNGGIWLAGAGISPLRLSSFPASITSRIDGFSLAPDGRHILLITEAGGFHGWLLTAPNAAPAPLPLPPRTVGPGPWRYIAISWRGGRTPNVLLAAGSIDAPRAVVGSFGAGPAGTVSAGWTSLGVLDGQLLSLSPQADHIALLETEPAAADFAAQSAVRLQRLDGSQPRVAWHAVGGTQPAALLWAPDGGTLAVVGAHGLAIQKSSGRTVRLAADGISPVSFSQQGESVAYISGSPGAWRIHVLRLHGEYDHSFPTPDGRVPRWLGWTPDARALVALSGTTLWEIAPDTGAAARLTGGVRGQVAGVAPAGTAFTP